MSSSEIKRNKLSIDKTWMDFKIIRLSERQTTKEYILYDSMYI